MTPSRERVLRNFLDDDGRLHTIPSKHTKLLVVLDRLAQVVARRTWLYLWAWRLAVAGGLGFAILVALATIH